jgi:predicted Fe-Mo cluster-binding NifX family protein
MKTKKLRVAISSSDGRMVDEHFGTAVQFIILDIEDEDIRFVERRPNQPACRGGTHGDGAIAGSIGVIADCQVLFTVRAGPPVLAELEARNVKVHMTCDSIVDAIENFLPFQ